MDQENEMNQESDASSADSSGSIGLPVVVTSLAGLVIAAALIWFFGFDVAIRGVGSLLVVAVMATGVGAVAVGIVAIVFLGLPAVSLLPVIFLGLKTAGVLIAAGVLLAVLMALLGGFEDSAEVDASNE